MNSQLITAKKHLKDRRNCTTETDIYLGGKHTLRVMSTDSPRTPFQLRPLVRTGSGRMVRAGNALRMTAEQLDELLIALWCARKTLSGDAVRVTGGVS